MRISPLTVAIWPASVRSRCCAQAIFACTRCRRCVDRLLAARDVAARRRRRDGHEGHEEREESPEAHRVVTSSVRRASLPAGAYSGCGGGLGAGVGSGTCAGPGGSDGSGVGSGTGTGCGGGLGSGNGSGDGRRRLDLGRLHLELRALNPLHRVCGCSLHLFLLRADEPVELCHPLAGRFRPFLVVSVHRFSEHTGALGPLRQQRGQLAAQPVELDARGRVDGDRLDGVAGRLAQRAEDRARAPWPVGRRRSSAAGRCRSRPAPGRSRPAAAPRSPSRRPPRRPGCRTPGRSGCPAAAPSRSSRS